MVYFHDLTKEFKIFPIFCCEQVKKEFQYHQFKTEDYHEVKTEDDHQVKTENYHKFNTLIGSDWSCLALIETDVALIETDVAMIETDVGCGADWLPKR